MKFFLSFFIREIKINDMKRHHIPGLVFSIILNDLEFSFFIRVLEMKDLYSLNVKNLRFGFVSDIDIDSLLVKANSILEYEKEASIKKIKTEYYDTVIIYLLYIINILLNLVILILLIYAIFKVLKKVYETSIYIYNKLKKLKENK